MSFGLAIHAFYHLLHHDGTINSNHLRNIIAVLALRSDLRLLLWYALIYPFGHIVQCSDEVADLMLLHRIIDPVAIGGQQTNLVEI